MYINEVERLDGFGQEIFPVKVTYPGPSSLLRMVQAFGKPVLMAVGQNGMPFFFSVA